MKKKKIIPPVQKQKQEAKKEVKVEEAQKNFETTDRILVDELLAKGFTLKTVASPQGDRKDKLYIFNETETKVREVL